MPAIATAKTTIVWKRNKKFECKKNLTSSTKMWSHNLEKENVLVEKGVLLLVCQLEFQS